LSAVACYGWTPSGIVGSMAEKDAESGIKLFDAILLIGAGAVAVVIVIFLLNVLAGIIWFAIKVLIVMAVVGFIGWLILHKRP
jgi:hypothetical protein